MRKYMKRLRWKLKNLWRRFFPPKPAPGELVSILSINHSTMGELFMGPVSAMLFEVHTPSTNIELEPGHVTMTILNGHSKSIQLGAILRMPTMEGRIYHLGMDTKIIAPNTKATYEAMLSEEYILSSCRLLLMMNWAK